jgi:hypothetical protein
MSRFSGPNPLNAEEFRVSALARRMLYSSVGRTAEKGIMETNGKLLRLISSVVGLSLGVGIGTATILLGVAALFQ